MFAPMLRLV